MQVFGFSIKPEQKVIVSAYMSKRVSTLITVCNYNQMYHLHRIYYQTVRFLSIMFAV